MKSSLLLLLCCAFSALTLAQVDKAPATLTPAKKFVTDQTSSIPSVSPAPSTNATTPVPSTNATTPVPSTNATTPVPSTNATTKAAPSTNATTPVPSTNTTTTPTSPPSPPKPTPPANLSVGNYSLMKDKVVCLMAQMALQIRLMTPKANGTFVVQPNKTKAIGECQENKANLTLVFQEGFITFMFNKSLAENKVYVDALSFVLSYPFSTANGQYAASNKSMRSFAAKIGHSYSCKSESLYMGNGLYLDVKQDRMQAFNLTKSNGFGITDPCAADQPDYRVAIGVGVTLLVLIVVVVVVYLLGRKRRTDGYQSL
ncbi:lysosome-associated membrane glycoprotein 1-like isoform X2 [Nerophis lumbriciformis]|uniref:lysosome-associated membrane glycoprotein 1-like isoform X2 n=1 Tax=Nerophis lumbriciformis TaxID=546530 RepID=UPI002ADFA89E|nr:macrosialin-like isoform X2 [Nerophis lumbriciformis]